MHPFGLVFSAHTRTTWGNDMHAHTTLSTIVSYRNEQPMIIFCHHTM